MNSQEFARWRHHPTAPVQPLVMGIVNATPDSFHDGREDFHPTHAYDRAMRLLDDGADLLDVGGESTRPGAAPVGVQEELDRVIPVIMRIKEQSDVCISIDTFKAPVMREAVRAGAAWINDIMALRHDAALATVAELDVPVCLMHMQGVPSSMQQSPTYHRPVVEEIQAFFSERVAVCVQAGLRREQLILDPGFGFGKSYEHNMSLMQHVADFRVHGLPLLLGVSHKRSLGVILNDPLADRVYAGLTLAIYAVLQGVSIIRTHDAKPTRDALMAIAALNDRSME